MSQQNWIEEQEEAEIFGTAENTEAAAPLLKREGVNRVITVKEAQLSIALRLLAGRLDGKKPGTFAWLVNLCDWVEDYQMGVGRPKNVRDAYQEALGILTGNRKPDERK